MVARSAGRGAGLRHASRQRTAHDGRVRLGQPDRARCTWATAARRRWATPSATCYATQGWDVCREFYYNDAGVQIATLATSMQVRARGFKPGDAEWPEAGLQRRLHRRTSPTTSWPARPCRSDDREFTASGDVDDLDGIRLFAVAYLRHEQDLDLQAFDVQFDNYYLESSLYTSGKVDAVVQQPA